VQRLTAWPLDPDCDEDALPDLQGHSISYRIALGSRRGQKAFTLQTLSPRGEERVGAAQANGFSLHAGVAAEACERSKLERLCRCISRPAVATQRLSLSAQGNIRYGLKTPYRDGTTHVVFEHGVFAPHHRFRARIAPGRGNGAQRGQGRATSRPSSMGWAQRLKRVFGIEIRKCEHCAGAVRIIACIEDAQIIEKILQHLGLDATPAGEALPRAPPGGAVLLD
jgi:hypothetical protein